MTIEELTARRIAYVGAQIAVINMQANLIECNDLDKIAMIVEEGQKLERESDAALQAFLDLAREMNTENTSIQIATASDHAN